MMKPVDNETVPQNYTKIQKMEIPDCPVCWERFNSSNRIPRLLSCGHTVCQLCLESLPTENRRQRRCVRCPECRYLCSWSSVQELPKNYILLRAMDSSGAVIEQQSRSNLPLGILSDLQLLFPRPSLVWAEGVSSPTFFKQKLRDVFKLTCIAGLIFCLVPVSLIPMLLAWWTAAIGFFIFLWLSVAGVGFCIFIIFVWFSCNMVLSIVKYYKFIFKKTASVFKTLASICNITSWIGFLLE